MQNFLWIISGAIYIYFSFSASTKLVLSLVLIHTQDKYYYHETQSTPKIYSDLPSL